MGILYNSRIVTDGLVGCWDVASARSSPGGGTTWTDLSKEGNDGTLTNGPITAEGINKGVISFDGTDDYVDCGSTFNGVLTGINSFTISCWVYVESGQVSHANILGNHSSNYTGITLQQDALNGGNFYFSFGTGSSWVNGGTFVVGTENWANVTIVKNSTSLLSYVNGQLVQSAANSESVTEGDYNLRLASGFTSGRFLKGKISNTYIYNRDLTAAEIKQNYNATKGRFSTTPSIVKENLVLHLDAGDSDSYPGTGTTWTDLTGSNDATLTNGLVYSSAGGGSFALDGTNDYAEVASHSSFQFGSDTDFTLEIWFRFDDYASGGAAWDRPLITNFLQSPTPRTGWLLGLAGSSYGTGCDGQARSIVGNSSTYGVDFGPGTDPTYGNGTNGTLIDDGNWHHLLLTVDRDGNAVIYVNGVAEATASYGTTADIDNTKELWIGRHQAIYSTLTLEGNISIVRIYNKSLTSGEVLQNYEAQKGRFV